MTREEAINKVRQMSLPKETMEILQALAPELHESEDERVRKWIIDFAKGQIDGYMLVDDDESYEIAEIWKEAIAYLEKQKEQKPIFWTELTWKDIVELEGIINNVHYDFSAGIGQESFGKEVLERFRNKKDGAEVDACEQKEQKPDIEICPHSVKSKSYKEQKPVDFPTTDEEVQEFLETHPKVKVPEKYKTSDFVFSKQEYESQPMVSKDTTSVKPVERSLEDDHIIGFIYDLLNEIEWKDNWAMSKDECLRRLNNYRPQKLTEEEIKKIRSEEYTKGFNDAAFGGKLKEWSEEDEKLLNYAISMTDDTQVKRFLKSLRPQSQHRDTYYDIIHSILAMLKDIDFMQITPEHRVSLLNDIRVRCKHADDLAKILDEP